MPVAVRGNVPTPEIVTVMLIGGQSALSMYTTLKRNDVPVLPTLGETDPVLSDMSWELPLQLAARTGVAVGSSTTQVATSRSLRMILMVRGLRLGDRTSGIGAIRMARTSQPDMGRMAAKRSSTRSVHRLHAQVG